VGLVAIHFIDPTARIGQRVKVWHFAVILADVVIGDDCSIGSGAEIGRGSIIGARTRISSGVFLPSGSKVGADVFIGPNATFTDDKYPKAGNTGYRALPPIVEDGASIGAGAVVLPGVIISSHALVGAGAVVSRDVTPYAMVRGEPAVMRWLHQEMI
jgi:UDP-2-acetamido-3-amino-2,3-dideoxy-glucuronate N-acetyltransferase